MIARSIRMLLVVATIGSLHVPIVRDSEAGVDIGVFADPQAYSCNISVPPLSSGSFYVLVTLGSGDADCVTGAEFRLTGFPTDWLVTSVVVDPGASVVLGDPLSGGANVAFGGGRNRWNEGLAIRLLRVAFFATSSITDRRLEIERYTSPSNPDFPCPIVTMCDACFWLM